MGARASNIEIPARYCNFSSYNPCSYDTDLTNLLRPAPSPFISAGAILVRNFAAFFGADLVFLLDYRSTLQSGSYLWSYGCGAGSYTSCSGVANTTNFTTDSLLSIFTMLFGSNFGDWDSDNNLLQLESNGKSWLQVVQKR